MARSFSNAKLLSTLLVDRVSISLSRRGYSAAAQSVSKVKGGGVMAARKGGEETTTAKTSWVPDPVTGYYRPEGHANDIDVAELREMLLKNNTTTTTRRN